MLTDVAGVRVGQVSRIALAPAGPQGLEMPVTAEFDRLQAIFTGQERPDREPLENLIRKHVAARGSE